MNRRKVGLLTLGMLLNWQLLTSAEDWPMWRGPRGDGVSLETSAPLTWSETENIRWKSPMPGRGLSSPIVVGEAVFLTTFMAEQNSRRLIKLDRGSGDIVWNVELHQGPVEKQHRFNSCASSTPAADNQCVYCLTVDDEKMWVVAVDFDGKQRWKVSPGSFGSQHGFAASPIICDGQVIVNGHQDGEAFIVSLDVKTGATIWSHQPAVKLRSFSTPVLTEFSGEKQLIVTGANQTVGLNPSTGKLIWFVAGPNQKAVSTPSVAGDVALSFAGSPSEKAMAVKLGGQGDVSETHVLWRSDKAMPYVPSPVAASGLLHVINDAGIYSCIEPATGKVLKTVRRGGNTYSSPIVAAGRVYLFEDSGRCTVIANDANFNVLAVNDLKEITQTTPAFAGGDLFVRTQEHLWCIRQ